MNPVHFSSASDDWATPQAFFDKLDEEFNFGLDACATAANTKCHVWFEEDSLSQDWSGFHAIWMNPPYGRGIGAWVTKAREASEHGTTVVCLLPARTDTRWWHDEIIAHSAEVRFVRGRLKFGNAKNSAPFPSAVVIFHGRTS